MPQQDGRLIDGPEEQYSFQGLLFRDGDPLDILVGKQWVMCHVHYEASDGQW